ncbi:MAG: adenylosuccinate lyase [Crenarchaeota archaeon]|nr:adenylosuccinate lyase [Thermoproteota archaeon]
MHVCPFEWRYGTEEMRKIVSHEERLKKIALVEYALLRALKELGIIPEVDPEEVLKAAEDVSVEEVEALEKELGHDIMAYLEALRRRMGEAGKYLHLGATSYDVVDTAWALTFREALSKIYKDLKEIIEKMIEMSIRYRDLPMVGRTHGQWAVPITLGFKFANYVYELARSYERLKDAEKRVVRLKLSGAVGTMASWGELAFEVERKVSEILGLEPHAISTQVAPRDGFAELVSALATLSSVLDRFALEVRELSRPEIGELVEGVGRRQVGSSTMPHKANPVTAEKISGLAKVARSLVIGELENVPLWHERDLTNSSSERVILPHAFLTVDEQLKSMKSLLNKLRVNEEAIRKHLREAGCQILAERVMIYLTLKKGVARNDAHRMVMDAVREHGDVSKAVEAGHEISKHLSREELEELCDPESYLGMAPRLVERAVEYARRVVSS